MRIGIIGSGHIGGTLAALFARAGHEVALSNSRSPDTLEEQVASLGSGAKAATPAEAARFGDVVVVAIPFGRYHEIPTGGVTGKIVIDATNYYPRRDGPFPDLTEDRTTSSELIQAHLGDARVVKAFNTIFWQWLRDRGQPAGSPDRQAIPISGNDADAKRSVESLIDQIGFDPVDAGDLANGRLQQPGTPLFTARVTRSEIEQELAARPE